MLVKLLIKLKVILRYLTLSNHLVIVYMIMLSCLFVTIVNFDEFDNLKIISDQKK